MANCQNQFIAFNQSIRLTDDQREMLKRVRNELRTRMNNEYQRIRGGESYQLSFQSQGSFVMDTIIQPANEDYDLDDGVYFIGNLPEDQRPKTHEYHEWIIESIGKYEPAFDPEPKHTCVRVPFKLGFHIDLPPYYTENYEHPELAHRTEGWKTSNPVEFINWFEEKINSGFRKAFLYEREKYEDDFNKWLSDIRKKDAQLRRIVRYFKAWADNSKKEYMPPGIIFTILAAENYVSDERDDVSFYRTAQRVLTTLEANGCECIRPTTPSGEDLFGSYTPADKKRFLDDLEKLVTIGRQAIEAKNQRDACLKWKSEFGSRYSCDSAKDEEEQARSFSVADRINQNAQSA